MRQLLRLIYIFAFHFGIIELFYRLNRARVLVLTYHNVLPDHLYDASPHLGVSHSESVFRAQIALVASRFTVSAWPGRPGSCVLTFDDGYKNQWEVAGSVLQEHRIPAVFFIAFGAVAEQSCLAVDRVLEWVSYCPPGSYEIFGQSIWVDENDRNHAWSEIYDGLLHSPARWSSITRELDQAYSFSRLAVSDDLERLRFTPLEESDLSAMMAAGYQVGCHSWQHVALASLSADELEADFGRCESARSRYTNSLLYSYPFGSSPAEVSRAVALRCREGGFSYAFLNTDSAVPGLDVDSKFTLQRSALPNTSDRYVLHAKLSGFEQTLRALLRR